MRCIDFDEYFSEFWLNWLKEHREEYTYTDEFEKAMPEIYDAFLETPADWLGGVKPCEYFNSFNDAGELVMLLSEYIDKDISVPDVLLERIACLGLKAEQFLLELLSPNNSLYKRMLAVTLLREIESEKPYKTYIDWLITGEDRELKDNAVESLELMGEKIQDELLFALEAADDDGKEAILSLLSRFSYNKQVYDALVDLFTRCPERRAQLSAYIARLGDDRAIPMLKKAARDDNTPYLVYIELRSAIEALGGEAPKHEYTEDDPAYLIFKDET
jgi:hypothetical protein